MIERITTNAKMVSNDDSHLKIFYLIKILFNKVNEIIDVVNGLERELEKLKEANK
jgi:hypothetical protein